jgi:hypothetical protein
MQEIAQHTSNSAFAFLFLSCAFPSFFNPLQEPFAHTIVATLPFFFYALLFFVVRNLRTNHSMLLLSFSLSE